MKHFKDPLTNALYAYEADGSQDTFIPAHLVPITDAEADAIRASLIPSPVSDALKLSFAQLLIGLVSERWITEADGEAWLTGTLPAAVTAVINTLPQEQRFAAKARALQPSEVLRTDPLVATMGAAAGKTNAEMDDFFRKYAQI